MSDFLEDQNIPDEYRDTIAGAAINGSTALPAAQLLNEALSGNSRYASSFFEEGFKRLYDQNTEEASKYLVEKRNEIPRDFYVTAVKHMINRLEAVSDHEAAGSWKKELE